MSIGRAAIYKEFHPIIPKQFEKMDRLEFETFNAAVDEFFSNVEAQRVESRSKLQEQSVMKRLNAIREDHKTRMLGLEESEASSVKKAKIIEDNLERVEEALFIIRSGLASGMDWTELKEVLNEETKKGNPITSMIADLDLAHNQIILFLPESTKDGNYDDDFDELSEDSYEELEAHDEEESGFLNDSHEKKQQKITEQKLKIEIDLSLSAFANARLYYDMKKHSQQKHQKTFQGLWQGNFCFQDSF